MNVRKASEPLYPAIREALELELSTRHAVGDILPSEGILAARFNVNRHTVRRALHGMVEAGWIERRRGLGSVVLSVPVRLAAGNGKIPYCIGQHTRFSEMLGAQGRKTSVRICARKIVGADDEMARTLQLLPGAPVAVLETLRSVDGSPFCRISHFLALARVPGVLEKYRGGSLHRFLEITYGWRLRRVVSIASALMPSAEDVRVLSNARTAPVLQVRSVNLRDIDAMPIECALTRFRSDRVELVISF